MWRRDLPRNGCGRLGDGNQFNFGEYKVTHLKLKAEDLEDLTIISAYLQDAVTIMADMVYQQKARRFVVMLNRFLWERDCADAAATAEGEMDCCRIRTGLHFNDVLKVSSHNISTALKTHPLELLSIEAYRLETGTYNVDFIFAGDGVIRLECEVISAYMKDIGEPWRAKCHPKHKVLEALQDENS